VDGVSAVFKPPALLIAFAVRRWGALRLSPALGSPLVAALAFSLLGDVFLLFGGFFIARLASFLVAHVCDVPVAPGRRRRRIGCGHQPPGHAAKAATQGFAAPPAPITR
jgi:uncharacterized membrane protein YhhN